MQRLTYQQAYDKIIQAYFKDEIKPIDSNFCFCGTLHGDCSWTTADNRSLYSRNEYGKMELALFSSFPDLNYNSVCNLSCFSASTNFVGSKVYEERLFAGMCAALEVLKQIHKDRGEDVDGVMTNTPFTKRNLSLQTLKP
jgi:hypothetical protein